MTFGAHFIDDLRARAFCDSLATLAGKSWGDPSTREELARRLAPHDPLERALEMLSAQSNCALVTCAALFEAGIDGMVRAWRGKLACDPLREPRWERYDAIMYAQHLARQRGTWRTPQLGKRPDLQLGSFALIGGGPEHGGAAHMINVASVDDDGTLRTVEGGKFDAGNPRKSPENCTAVEACHRRLYEQPGGSWWIGDASPAKSGRRLIGWCWVGDLPAVSS